MSPRTGLVDRQRVTISIHGLRPDGVVWVSMCVGRPQRFQDAENQCNVPATIVDLDAKGAAQVRFVVDQYLRPGGFQVDCATYKAGCSIGLVDPTSTASRAVVGNTDAVTFQESAPEPPNPLQMTISPSPPFRDGQVVTVSGMGFAAGSSVRIWGMSEYQLRRALAFRPGHDSGFVHGAVAPPGELCRGTGNPRGR